MPPGQIYITQCWDRLKYIGRHRCNQHNLMWLHYQIQNQIYSLIAQMNNTNDSTKFHNIHKLHIFMDKEIQHKLLPTSIKSETNQPDSSTSNYYKHIWGKTLYVTILFPWTDLRNSTTKKYNNVVFSIDEIREKWRKEIQAHYICLATTLSCHEQI
mgnify:CR=1 FL=1